MIKVNKFIKICSSETCFEREENLREKRTKLNHITVSSKGISNKPDKIKPIN